MRRIRRSWGNNATRTVIEIEFYPSRRGIDLEMVVACMDSRPLKAVDQKILEKLAFFLSKVVENRKAPSYRRFEIKAYR